MTTKQLENQLFIRGFGSGSYFIEIIYNNQVYSCHSNDSICYDRIHMHRFDMLTPLQRMDGITYKQALMQLWYECKSKNNIL